MKKPGVILAYGTPRKITETQTTAELWWLLMRVRRDEDIFEK